VTYYASGLAVASTTVHFKRGTTEFDVPTTASGAYSSQVVPGDWEISPRHDEGAGSAVDSADAAAALGGSVGMTAMPGPMGSRRMSAKRPHQRLRLC
jgi:hypothetical protein